MNAYQLYIATGLQGEVELLRNYPNVYLAQTIIHKYSLFFVVFIRFYNFFVVFCSTIFHTQNMQLDVTIRAERVTTGVRGGLLGLVTHVVSQFGRRRVGRGRAQALEAYWPVVVGIASTPQPYSAVQLSPVNSEVLVLFHGVHPPVGSALDLGPCCGVSQCLDIGVGNAIDLCVEESHSHPGVNGRFDGSGDSDYRIFSCGDQSYLRIGGDIVIVQDVVSVQLVVTVESRAEDIAYKVPDVGGQPVNTMFWCSKFQTLEAVL